MLDVLALLDAAIDRLATTNPTADLREERDFWQKGSAIPADPVSAFATGTSNSLESLKKPVVPVNPVEKRHIRGDGDSDSNCDAHTSAANDRAIRVPFSYGITGTTGNLQDFCGFEASRNAKSSVKVTGTTGKVADFLEFVAALDPASPPGDVPRRRWVQFIDDAHAFIASGFARQAVALGWSEADLFGCDDIRPFSRIDQMGLLWLVKGGRVVAVTADTAVIETVSGTRMTYRRKELPASSPSLIEASR